ncbi:MAG TPA: hypothetical protein VGG14_13250 [Candidatus Sulfotelmatobacter sp.]|jgi:hypothetical protein
MAIRKQDIRAYFAKFGKKGGEARARNLTPEQRSEAARKAVQARWAKMDKLMKEITTGTRELLRVAEKGEKRLAGKKKPRRSRKAR